MFKKDQNVSRIWRLFGALESSHISFPDTRKLWICSISHASVYLFLLKILKVTFFSKDVHFFVENFFFFASTLIFMFLDPENSKQQHKNSYNCEKNLMLPVQRKKNQKNNQSFTSELTRGDFRIGTEVTLFTLTYCKEIAGIEVGTVTACAWKSSKIIPRNVHQNLYAKFFNICKNISTYYWDYPGWCGGNSFPFFPRQQLAILWCCYMIFLNYSNFYS